MTLKEALLSGYKKADCTYQRGYVSRKVNVDEQTVYTAGGSRKGEKYVLLPTWESSQYCIRQYLKKG